MNHFIKKGLGISSLLLLSVFGNKMHAQGAATAMHFAGTTANEHVNLGQALSDSLKSGSFTIEMWLKVNGTGGDPSFIANKDWNNGANTGIAWVLGNGSSTQLKFNFKPAGGTRLDPVVTIPSLTTAWNHIAAVVNRPTGSAGSITIYVNGVQGTTAVIPLADTGKTVSGLLPMQLSQDGTGTYSVKFNGDMDELRIWKSARTLQEVRDNMCHKLTGSESGLYAYYKMDEASTSTLVNSAASYLTSFAGTQVNNPTHVNSGAAIGDTSVNLYATSFTGQTLSLTSSSNGNVQLSNVANTMGGIHLYKINGVPNTTAGIAIPGSNNVYYGVFPVTATAAYDVSYDYTNFPAAITYESGTGLYERYASDSTWALGTFVKNQGTNIFAKTATTKRDEFIIGNFANLITCNTPSAQNATNITPNSANLMWTTGGSNLWNVSYGAGTANAASGTIIHNLSSTNYILNGLSSNTDYWYYVQDTCASINGASSWAGPFTFSTPIDYGTYGSGYDMNFQGTAANEHVNLGDSLSGAMAQTNFTIESWIKFNNPSGDPAFIGNKNWNSGTNTGFLWCWNGSNNLRFNFRTANGTRKDYDINVPNPSKWNHIAMVVDRGGYLTAYLNGIQVGTPQSIAADSGKTLDGTLPVRIGQDGTGTYGIKFKGAMDELRIWKKAMTQDDIRSNMCRKLSGTDTNLLAYYKMDETSGNVLTNSALATSTLYNGTLTNNPQRQISGAAIGDTSVYMYASSWNALQLQLSSIGTGSVTIDSIGNGATGVQLYRVNNAPNFQTGIVDLGTTNQYFGVFTAGSYNADYTVKYNYSSYPNAVTNHNNVHLYNRAHNAATSWIQLPAMNNIVSNVTGIHQSLGVKEYLLSDFSAAICPSPDSVIISNVDTSGAIIEWALNSAQHIIQYGMSGFALGSGTNIIDTDDSLHIDGLPAATTFDFYIHDSCSAANNSAWVGPFTFTTLNPCSDPANITADNIASSALTLKWSNTGIVTTGFSVSWGPTGFGDPAIGISQNATDTFSLFTGLSANTAYDFYVRANCNSNVANSGWVGPFTFTTIGCDMPTGVTIGNITANSSKLSWTSAALMHNVQYGPGGFTIGNGSIQHNITAANYIISGLTANTDYDVYMQDSCSDVLGSSVWVGPIAFKTLAPTGIRDIAANDDVVMFPNPANDKVVIQSKHAMMTDVTVFNNIGQVVFMKHEWKGQQEVVLNMQALQSGIYTIKITTGKGSQIVKRITVQH